MMKEIELQDNVTLTHLDNDEEKREITLNLKGNKYNNAFYEELKAEGLQSLSKEKGGLSTGCDLKVIKPYWSKARKILEVGAGSGRVIEQLLKQGYKGQIVAVERCKNSVKYLEKYHKKNVTIVPEDIFDFSSGHEKFDVALMLWSGLADFAPSEQKAVIKKLFYLLESNGNLIIDTMPAGVTPIGMGKKTEKTVYHQTINGATIYTYSITISKLEQYAYAAGFSNIKHLKYFTDTGRERELHILNK